MNLPLLIEPAQLQEALDTVLVVDLSQSALYQQAHIPGALHIDAAGLFCGSAPVPNKLADEQQLSAFFSALGLSEDRHLLVYDDKKGQLAGRMIWTLHMIGHQRCSFLNGHLQAWLQEGLPIENTLRGPEPCDYRATIEGPYRADIPYLLEHLDDPEVTIWDTRTEAEYQGVKRPPIGPWGAYSRCPPLRMEQSPGSRWAATPGRTYPR